MKPAELDAERKAKIDAFLDQSLLARLATAAPKNLQPHVVPLWYLWDGCSVWINSYYSTRKIHELAKNPRCAVLVDVSEAKGGLSAVLLEGQAELVTEPKDFVQAMTTRIYLRYLGPEGVLAKDPQEWIYASEATLVKLTPAQIYSW